MGSIYYAYPTPNGIQTPVPEGYSPFYVSHYGRHGSRWMTSDERYLEVIRVFDTFHNKSGLTDLGEDVRLRLQKVWENARGRGGNLTPLGERQHKAIAKRLYQQYPHIFRDSANISARSSVSVRCIMSMSAFTEQLKELTPPSRSPAKPTKDTWTTLPILHPKPKSWVRQVRHGEQLSIHSKKIIFIRNV